MGRILLEPAVLGKVAVVDEEDLERLRRRIEQEGEPATDTRGDHRAGL